MMLIRRAAAPAYNVANQKHASTRENEELKNSVLTELGVAAVAVAYGKRAAVSAPRQEACKPSAAQAEACTQEACGTQRVQRGDQRCALGVLQKRCSQNLDSVEATQQDKINHHIGSTVGFGRATFRGVFRDFPTIPSSAFNKSRTDRPRQSTEESSAPTSLHQRKSSKKLLREIDGTKSEQAFVDLGNFCSLQLENKAPLPYSQIWLG